MQLCFFSDEIADNFLPLTLTRPVWDLRIGILTIREKWEQSLSTFYVKGILEPHLQSLFSNHQLLSKKNCLWVNSRFLPTNDVVSNLLNLSENCFIEEEGVIIAALVSYSDSKKMLEAGGLEVSGLHPKKADFELNQIIHLWDLLSKNGEEISADINRLGTEALLNEDELINSICTHSDQIFIEDDAIIEPGCIFIADKGPIYIGNKAVIEAGSILRGPVAVCEGATVKMRARIYDSTTIGPACKIGGEVSNSIFHSYSNKGHDGFVGSSIIGQWCNFGADTNTSNLKNNYGTVHLQNWKNKEPYQEGVQFLGTVMGDHSKTSINTMLNTGTVCGVSSNIFCSGFPPKFIPSFSWLGDKEVQTYRFEKALEAMRAMMKRRNVELSEEYRQMMNQIFVNKL